MPKLRKRKFNRLSKDQGNEGIFDSVSNAYNATRNFASSAYNYGKTVGAASKIAYNTVASKYKEVPYMFADQHPVVTQLAKAGPIKAATALTTAAAQTALQTSNTNESTRVSALRAIGNRVADQGPKGLLQPKAIMTDLAMKRTRNEVAKTVDNIIPFGVGSRTNNALYAASAIKDKYPQNLSNHLTMMGSPPVTNYRQQYRDAQQAKINNPAATKPNISYKVGDDFVTTYPEIANKLGTMAKFKNGFKNTVNNVSDKAQILAQNIKTKYNNFRRGGPTINRMQQSNKSSMNKINQIYGGRVKKRRSMKA